MDSLPDLKESFSVGPETPSGDSSIGRRRFNANAWPIEVPELRPLIDRWTSAMHGLAKELLELLAMTLGMPSDTLTGMATRPTWSFVIHRYPSLREVGCLQPKQFRAGAHSDFGAITILDREPGVGGLQIYHKRSGWVDAPFIGNHLTVNIGELLSHWSGLRWVACRHRVLPPPSENPYEELISLVFFYELNHDARIVPLAPPLGRSVELQPIIAGSYVQQRLAQISVDK